MKTDFTNSRGEYITVGQLAVRSVVYGAGTVGMMVCAYWALVFAFCC